jgi:N-acetylglucosaminyldiphosphoundecaprenol N-acetyl-beta-D-mannosaminyltransferase
MTEPPRRFETRDVLGIPVAALGGADLARQVLSDAADRRGGQVFALNVHTYTEACRQSSYRRVLKDSYLVFADGVPISWAAGIAGSSVPRTHGHDFMMETLRLSQGSGIGHYFFGGTDETLAAMVARLKTDMPGLRIAGAYSPPFRRLSDAEEAGMAEQINASGAGVLWVALGAPRQERWIHRMRLRVKVPVQAGVGAAFEIIAGRFRRAPLAAQKLGLEWAWRLGQDPGRLWRRYLSTNGYFMTVLLREAARRLIPFPSPRA